MKESNDKFKHLNKLLLDEYAIVQINTAHKGVTLPAHLIGDPSVSLKLSKLFIGGMEVTPEKIEANLSFNKKYFLCIIPLEAVWSITSVKQETMVWPDSAPEEIIKKLLNPEVSPAPEKTEKKKPALKRIK